MLQELRVDDVESIKPAALGGLQELRKAHLRSTYRMPAQRDTAPVLPPEMFEGLEKLEKTETRRFRE